MGFVFQPGLTIDDVFGLVHADTNNDDDGEPIVVLDVERADSATGSIDKFMRALHMAQTPGAIIDGRVSPIRNGVVRMKDVGVVVRDAQGVRLHAPPGTPRLPTLYAPTNGSGVFAAFGGALVAKAPLVAIA